MFLNAVLASALAMSLTQSPAVLASIGDDSGIVPTADSADQKKPEENGDQGKSDEEKAAQDAAAEAQPQVEATTRAADGTASSFTILALGKEKGSLASFNCRKSDGDGRDSAYAVMAALKARMAGEIAQAKGGAPIVLGMGDTLFPGTFGSYLLSGDGSKASGLADVMSAMGYDVIAMGNHDMGAGPQGMQAFYKAAKKAGLPFLAANMKCSGARSYLCDAATGEKPYRILERNGLKVGVTAISDPMILNQMVKDRADGITLEDVKDTLKSAVKAMRDDGADLTVAVLHLGDDETAPKMEKMLEDLAGLDLVVTDDLFQGDASTEEVTRMGAVRLPRTGTVVIGSSTSPSTLMKAVVSVEARDGRWVIKDVVPESYSARGVEADPSMTQAIARASGDFCSDWGKTLNESARLEKDFSHEDMSTFILNTIRFTVKAEVAAMNTGAFRGRDIFPIQGSISQNDIRSVLPFNSQVIIANIKGEALEKAAGFMGKGVTFAGLEKGADGKFRVNGRILDKKRTYSIALNEFLSDGSGGYIDPKTLKDKRVWMDDSAAAQDAKASENGAQASAATADGSGSSSSDGGAASGDAASSGSGSASTSQANASSHQTNGDAQGAASIARGSSIADLVSASVARGDFAIQNSDGSLTFSPTGGFPDLHLKMLWRLGGHLNASYSHMNIIQPGRTANFDGDYDKSRLTATPTDHLNVDFKLIANGATRNHGWDNDFVIQYATTREKGPGESGEFAEDKDIVRLRSAYKYLGQRANYGDAWYVPVPFAEGQVETELTKSDDAANHPLDLTGIAGLLLQITKDLEFKVGVNVRGDVLEDDGHPSVGFFTGYRLLKTELFKVGSFPVKFESEAEYFYNSDGSDRIHEFHWENRLFFNINDYVAFTANFNMYVYRTRLVGETGRAIEGMVGINVSYERMLQNF